VRSGIPNAGGARRVKREDNLKSNFDEERITPQGVTSAVLIGKFLQKGEDGNPGVWGNRRALEVVVAKVQGEEKVQHLSAISLFLFKEAGEEKGKSDK